MSQKAQLVTDHFLTLTDMADRQAASLTPYDLRGVKKYMDVALRLQRDILAEIPMELKCILVQYLNTNDIFRLREVSPQWKDILSNRHVMAAMINRRMERKPDPKEPLEKLESILKTRWRTENGVIGNVARVCKDDPEDVDTVAVKYCKGIIAENNVETVRVHNVRTGEQKTFMAEHRKLLDRVDTSGRLVAATPPRFCYVWDTETEELKRFRMPCASCQAMLMYENWVVLQFPGMLMVINYDTGKSRKFPLEDGLLFGISLRDEGYLSVIYLQDEKQIAKEKKLEAERKLEAEKKKAAGKKPAGEKPEKDRQLEKEEMLKRYELGRLKFGEPVHREELREFKLVVKSYSLKGTRWKCEEQKTHIHDIVSFVPEWLENISIGNLMPIRTGQHCCWLALSQNVQAKQRCFLHFTLEDNVLVGQMSPESKCWYNEAQRMTQFITDDNLMHFSYDDKLVVASRRSILRPMPPGAAMYQFDEYRVVPDHYFKSVIPSLEYSAWHADDDFYVLNGVGALGGLHVAALTDDWEPVGAMKLVQASKIRTTK